MKRVVPTLCRALPARSSGQAEVYTVGSASCSSCTPDRVISGRFCSSSAPEVAPGRLESRQCWKCGQCSSEGFFCSRCDAIQAPSSDTDYFSLLGVPERSYDVDVSSLERLYRRLQSRLHPDKYAMGSEEERTYSAEASSLVNKAYSTLKSPLQRASYMLRQQGIGADEEEGTMEDPEFLMEMMEAREAVDDAADAEALAQLQADYTAKQQACIQGMSSAFSRGDYASAYQSIVRLRYLRRILDAINDRL